MGKGTFLHPNFAEYETIVELAKNQNIIYGEIVPQSKFVNIDPAQLL